MSEPAEDLQQKKDHLKALEVFLASEAYVGYRSAREAEIEVLKDGIVAGVDSGELSGILRSISLAGELRSQREMLETFSDARESLLARIDEIVERENKITTTKKV